MDVERETLPWHEGWIISPPAASQPPETRCLPGFRLDARPGEFMPDAASPVWRLEIADVTKAGVLAHGCILATGDHGFSHCVYSPAPGTLCGEADHNTGVSLSSSKHEVRHDGSQSTITAAGLCVALIVEKHPTGLRWALVWSDGNEHETVVHAKAGLSFPAKDAWEKLIAGRRQILDRAECDAGFRPAVIEAVELLLGSLRPPDGALPGLWLDTRTQSSVFDLGRALAALPALACIAPREAAELHATIMQLRNPDNSLPPAVAPNETWAGRHAPFPMLAQSTLALWRHIGSLEFARGIVPQLVPLLAQQIGYFESQPQGVCRWQQEAEALVPEIHDAGLATPDAGALLLAELEALRELAAPFPDLLPVVAPLLATREKLDTALRDFFWNGEKGSFRSRYLDGRIIARSTAADAMPLLSATLSPSQITEVAKLIEPGGALRMAYGIANWARWAEDETAPAASPLIQILLLRALRRRGLDNATNSLAHDLAMFIQDAQRKSGMLPVVFSENGGEPGRAIETAALVVHLAFGDELALRAARSRVSPFLGWLDRQRNGLAAAAVIAAVGAGAIFAWPALLNHGATPPETRLSVAQLRCEEGDWRGAIAIYQELLGAPLRDSAAVDFRLGNAWFHLEGWTQAEASYRTALDRNPDQPRAWMNLALSLYKQDRFADAKKIYGDFVSKFARYYPDLAARAQTAIELCDEQTARAR